MLRFIGTLLMALFFASCAMSMAQTYETIHSGHLAKIEQEIGQ